MGGEEQKKTTETQHEKVITLSDKTISTLGRGNDVLEAFKIAQSETADETSSYQDIMQGVEKRKADLAKTALADTKRSDKLSTRAAAGAWNWVKGKGKAVGKMAGSFFDNLLKLLGLLALWFALTWLKGKDLKKIFEDFKDYVQEIIDDYIPQWMQDLSPLEALGVAIGGAVAAVVAAWAAWKLGVKGAG